MLLNQYFYYPGGTFATVLWTLRLKGWFDLDDLGEQFVMIHPRYSKTTVELITLLDVNTGNPFMTVPIRPCSYWCKSRERRNRDWLVLINHSDDTKSSSDHTDLDLFDVKSQKMKEFKILPKIEANSETAVRKYICRRKFQICLI